jgi:formylglycine-generating enzyme required for sulfatase activity
MGEPVGAGTRINKRYVLEASIGEGTFGEVWKASDGNLPGVVVAVKLLKREFLDRQDAVDRFNRESLALAALEHPNVVRVLERGEWDGGWYFVMELVKGESLEAWLKAHTEAGTLPALDEVREIFDQICAGVEAVHDVRAPDPIVHRDLKPANIMVARVRKGSRATKVLDFGLARLGAHQRTKSGFQDGTLTYMSPEQGTGEASEVGPWSDVFSLGVILVEMLSLQQLVGGKRLWWAVAMVTQVDLEKHLQGVRSDVPAAVVEVAAKALAGAVPERFADAGAMREALKGAWASSPAPTTTSLPPSPQIQPARNSVPAPEPQPRATAAARTDYLTELTQKINAPLREPATPPNQLAPAVKTGTLANPKLRYIALGAVGILGVVGTALGGAFNPKPNLPTLVIPNGSTSTPVPSASVIPSVVPSAPTSALPPGGCPDGMVSIARGTFQMGSKAGEGDTDEQPQHPETVEAFCLDETEVTVAAYRACVYKGKSKFLTPATGGYCNWGVANREDHPINCVDWEQAKAYCEAESKRLPTEKEWEYAARGVELRTYPWGSLPRPSNQICWDGDGSDLGRGNRFATCKVGAYKRGDTPLGVHDMAGNVSEWTADLYCPYEAANCAEAARVIRGGGWFTGTTANMRGAVRFRVAPSLRDDYLGFRCARAN